MGNCSVAKFIWVEIEPASVFSVPHLRSSHHGKSPTVSSARSSKGQGPGFLFHLKGQSFRARTVRRRLQLAVRPAGQPVPRARECANEQDECESPYKAERELLRFPVVISRNFFKITNQLLKLFQACIRSHPKLTDRLLCSSTSFCNSPPTTRYQRLYCASGQNFCAPRITSPQQQFPGVYE